MRTVTFSDATVVKALNKSFVCAWVNKRPVARFQDRPYPSREWCRIVANGFAATNVTSVFATPDGTVIHAMPGTLDADAFRMNLEFARGLHERMLQTGEPRTRGKEIYIEAHQKAAGETKEWLSKRVHARMTENMRHVSDFSLKLFEDLDRFFR